MRIERNCVFCGSRKKIHTIHEMLAMDAATENGHICQECLNSIGNHTTMEWFRWLKRNNPVHWQRLIDHHRLGLSKLSNTIRIVRIEPEEGQPMSNKDRPTG